MALRLRMLAVLGVLVGVNALFVLAVLWGFGVLLPTVVTAVFVGEFGLLSDLLRLPVSPLTAAALVALFLGGQVYYGYRRVLSGTVPDSGEGSHEVDEVVRRLSMAVDVPPPRTLVLEDETPSCYTVGRFTDATIVVTTGLLSTLDRDELEAVIAHEIAHVLNRDVTLMTVTTLVLEITTRVSETVRLVPRAFSGSEDLTTFEWLALRWFLPLSVVVYLLVAPLLVVFPRVADWATRTLSHAREFAADEGAARMTGDPLALATALVELSEATPTPRTDLRRERTQALCVVPTQPVTGSVSTTCPEPDDPDDDREETVTAWVAGRSERHPASGTHPPLERRIARLQSLVGEQEEER